MSRTVYLHVGIAKTGTSYLQRKLFANRELLKRHGTLYPGAGPAAHFLGSLDLRGTAFKGHVYDGVEGAWQRLVAAADGYDGATLISHETLARALPAHIERAVTGFATDDVRVVVTCRDLARQIPACWQETLKNRGEVGYDDYLAQVFASWHRKERPRKGFWVAQDVEAVVRRWGDAVGVGNVTVVTVPRSGADRDELWRRFAAAADLPDVAYASGRDTANSSLGVAEAELLRRLNPLLADTLEWPGYDALIKRRLAENVLAPLDSQGRLALPDRYAAGARDIADWHIGYLTTSGVRVVGDVADLEPGLPDPGARGPEELSDGEVLATALRALAIIAAEPPVPTGTGRAATTLRRTARRVSRWWPPGS